MKKIDIHNYKEFAVDYMIGNLSEEMADKFSTFLSEHPSIADEILLFDQEQVIEKPEVSIFAGLKKELDEQEITDDNFEEYCIASMEGDLSDEAEAKLSSFIEGEPVRMTIKNEYAKTILPLELIVYPNKEDLKKTVHTPFLKRKIVNISTIVAAAAVITFGLFIIPPKQTETPKPLAEKISDINTDTEDIKEKPSPAKVDLTAEALPKVTPKEKRKKNTAPKIVKQQQQQQQQQQPTIRTHETLGKLSLKRHTMPNNAIALNDIKLSLPHSQINTDETQSENSKLRNETKKLLYSKVFAKGVDSLNKMAETNLGYEIIVDEEGNPIRVIITSRFGEIDRTLAQR